MNKLKFNEYIDKMYKVLRDTKKDIKGYQIGSDAFGGFIYFYKENLNTIYYCSPAWEMSYEEYQNNNNNIRINFEVDDGDFLDETSLSIFYMPLTFDLDLDINNYYGILESYIDENGL